GACRPSSLRIAPPPPRGPALPFDLRHGKRRRVERRDRDAVATKAPDCRLVGPSVDSSGDDEEALGKCVRGAPAQLVLDDPPPERDTAEHEQALLQEVAGKESDVVFQVPGE